MLHKKKNKNPLPKADVNVTSLMDILTTLLFFILMVLSFNDISIIEAFAPQNGESVAEKKQVFNLKISCLEKGKMEINLGPMNELKKVDESRLMSFLKKEFKGTQESGFKKTITWSDPKEMKSDLRSVLMGIKLGFPHEHQVTLALGDKVAYQEMVDVMETTKTVPEGRTLELKNLIGQTEITTVLFPSVVLVEH